MLHALGWISKGFALNKCCRTCSALFAATQHHAQPEVKLNILHWLVLKLPGLVGFTAAFHCRVSAKSNFGLWEKQITVPMEASPRRGARLPKAGTWDLPWQGTGEGRSWGGHGLLSSAKIILVSLPKHVSCWKKKKECSRKRNTDVFWFQVYNHGIFRKHCIYFNIYWSQTYLVSLQMRCAKPYRFILYTGFLLLVLHSFPCIHLLCTLSPALEDAQSHEDSAAWSLPGLGTSFLNFLIS